MDTVSLSCQLRLTPQDDGDIALAFDVRNPGAEPAEVGFFFPFLGFELAVDADDGPIPVVQPAYHGQARPLAISIAPGATERIETPIRLRFDPQVPPSGGDDPSRWSLAHEPVPVRVRAELHLDGSSVGPCEALFDPRGERE